MKFSEIVAQELYSDGVICDDCLMWVANADDSGASDDWDRVNVDSTLERYDVLHGDDHEEFSTSDCGLCGTDLAGSRTSARFIERSLLD